MHGGLPGPHPAAEARPRQPARGPAHRNAAAPSERSIARSRDRARPAGNRIHRTPHAGRARRVASRVRRGRPDVVSEPTSNGFVRVLTRIDATALVIGSMIGSGIFIVSAGILREVVSPGLMLVVWGVSGLLTLLGALTY